MTRNPAWTRDEIILALDLYFRVNPVNTSEKNPEIIELSRTLNKLPIFPDEIRNENFRNPTGVYMKLCNFLNLDPGYAGVGLDAGSKLDELIWIEFSNDKKRLHKIANIIKSHNISITTEPKIIINDIDDEFPEGRIVTRLHKNRERNQIAVTLKKNKILNETGSLTCEICNFDFYQFYGDIGNGFAECHHTIPVSDLLPDQKTKISDLSIVCANCHRMLHRTKPIKSIAEFKADLLKKKDKIYNY